MPSQSQNGRQGLKFPAILNHLSSYSESIAMFRKSILAGAAALVVVSTAAIAAVTFDPATGTGFVGKGDVQLALNWNNKQLQDGASSLAFTYNSTTEVETTWDCVNTRNENIQERSRTTTSTTTGVVSATERVRNQVTGFILSGFSGSTSTSSTSGPPLNSCPNANSSHVLGSTVVGEPVTLPGSGLSVNGQPLQ